MIQYIYSLVRECTESSTHLRSKSHNFRSTHPVASKFSQKVRNMYKLKAAKLEKLYRGGNEAQRKRVIMLTHPSTMDPTNQAANIREPAKSARLSFSQCSWKIMKNKNLFFVWRLNLLIYKNPHRFSLYI